MANVFSCIMQSSKEKDRSKNKHVTYNYFIASLVFLHYSPYNTVCLLCRHGGSRNWIWEITSITKLPRWITMNFVMPDG